MKTWSHRDAEDHGYIYRCPVCGSGPSDSPGPCSDRCGCIYEDEHSICDLCGAQGEHECGYERCHNCGEPFEVDDERARYCSVECAHEALVEDTLDDCN